MSNAVQEIDVIRATRRPLQRRAPHLALPASAAGVIAVLPGRQHKGVIKHGGTSARSYDPGRDIWGPAQPHGGAP